MEDECSREGRRERKALRAAGSPDVSEALIFKTIARQRQIVARAATQTRQATRLLVQGPRSDRPALPWPDLSITPLRRTTVVNYDNQPAESHVELW